MYLHLSSQASIAEKRNTHSVNRKFEDSWTRKEKFWGKNKKIVHVLSNRKFSPKNKLRIFRLLVDLASYTVLHNKHCFIGVGNFVTNKKKFYVESKQKLTLQHMSVQ